MIKVVAVKLNVENQEVETEVGETEEKAAATAAAVIMPVCL